MKVVKLRNIVIIAVLFCGVVVSGCADKSIPEEETVADDNESEISVADELLSEEMVGITDSEIRGLEVEMAELEALIGEIDLEEDIVLEEI